jgi:hypothetical protein
MRTITEAAYELGFEDVLNDPDGDEIVLAAVEMSKGHWPENFSVDRHFAERIVEEYGKGEADRHNHLA